MKKPQQDTVAALIMVPRGRVARKFKFDDTNLVGAVSTHAITLGYSIKDFVL